MRHRLEGWRAVVLGFVLAALVALIFRREATIHDPASPPEVTAQDTRVRTTATSSHASALTPGDDAHERAIETTPLARASDRGRAAADPEREGARSHPLDDQRARLQHELQLVGALDDALDSLDTVRMRQLIEVYRSDHPAEPNGMREGYERLLECIEAPGEQARERALRYYERSRASTLRRYVRRHCFESEQGS
jgi:hypothetical protein